MRFIDTHALADISIRLEEITALIESDALPMDSLDEMLFELNNYSNDLQTSYFKSLKLERGFQVINGLAS